MLQRLQVLLQYIVPQHLLSRMTGWLAEAELGFISQWMIRLFVKCYKVDMSEAVHAEPKYYKSFNHFFARDLKPDVRKVEYGDNNIVSPADGAVSQFGQIHESRLFQAKGKHFSLTQLLGGHQKMSALFYNGQFATIYLAPRDYHRVHMPVSGKLLEMIYVPGDLFSVNTKTATHINGLFARNERLICLFETMHGPMAMILVGAMIVASIETAWSGCVVPAKKKSIRHWQYAGESLLQNKLVSLEQGEEMGRFKLGSTVILCFPPGGLAWHNGLASGSTLKMGQKVGEWYSSEVALE